MKNIFKRLGFWQWVTIAVIIGVTHDLFTNDHSNWFLNMLLLLVSLIRNLFQEMYPDEIENKSKDETTN